MAIDAHKSRMLKDVLPGRQVLTDPAELLVYELDAGLMRGRPDAVAFPRTTAEVAQLVRWAARHRVPLVARGAGTGTTGGAVAERGGVIVELGHMSSVQALDSAGLTAVVEPGVVNLDLDERARASGLFFPPDPASGRVCTLGGNIAENAGGPRCFKYGVTTNYVLGVTVVLADGRVLRLGGRGVDYPEYDFTGILTGSEGTLGIVTEATLRLLRKPAATKMLMAAFDSIQGASEAVSAIIARGLTPATIEMMDQAILQIVEDYSHIGLPVDAAAVLIVEVDGYEGSLAAQVEEIAAVLRDGGVRDLWLAQTAEEREKIWRARKDSAGALAWLAPAYYASDCTVPRSKIAPALREMTRICEAYRVRVCYLLHAGDGNLHPNLLVEDANDHELMGRVLAAEAEALKLFVEMGGSIRGEHGVGIEGRHLMPLMYNAGELAAMRDIKHVFDPGELLNPGKIFPAEAPVAPAPPPPGPPPASPFAPASAEEAAAAVRACAANDPPVGMRVRGGGTKSDLLPPADLTLSTRHLRGLLAYAPEDMYVTLGAGTPLAELQAGLAHDRMWVPLVSPWPEATLGGIASTNFNAPLRMRYGYGAVRDLVLAVTAVLPDGRVIRVGRPVVKNVAGYDMPKLFVGAHGTLGLIADLTLKVVPLPRARSSLVIALDDLDRGLALGMNLRRVCLVASALLLCRGCDVPELSAPYALVYTAEGVREDVAAELAEVRRVAQSHGAGHASQVEDLSGSELWAAWLGAATPGETSVRVGVAPKELPRIVPALSSQLGAASSVVDVANGLVYLRGVPGADDLVAMRGLVSAAGGYAAILSAPPGLAGRVDRWGCTPDGLDLMRGLKARWDPRGVFNPRAFFL